MAPHTDYHDALKFYFSKGYNTKEITASVGRELGTWRSIRTTQSHLRSLGLIHKGCESPLPSIIDALKSLLEGSAANQGVNRIYKRLRHENKLLVKRQTVADLIDIMQPERAAAMKKGRLKRRAYKVKGPNHMWHTDGNDKIKQFGFALHGCIDGFSRKLIWLEVSRSNKEPKLIASYYLKAIDKLGKVPLILRMDRGTENVVMADFQSLLRHDHDDSLKNIAVLFGSSNHNQRIERFWGVLRNSILQIYMDMFKDFLLAGLLDLSKFEERECLVFCFMDIIRTDLTQQMRCWNQHRVRKMKSCEMPTGIPDFLYDFPEEYSCSDEGKPFNTEVYSYCEEQIHSDRNMNDCDTTFQEWALSAMNANGWSFPDTRSAAMTLYGDLLGLLRN